MIGIVLVSHGCLAQEFEKAIEHIVGKQEQLIPISILPKDDIESKRKEILKAVKKVDKEEGVIILTDMFGGTPSNLAHSLLEGRHLEIISGMNLPLLVKLISIRKTKELHEAAALAQEAGRKYIHSATQALKEPDVQNG